MVRHASRIVRPRQPRDPKAVEQLKRTGERLKVREARARGELDRLRQLRADAILAAHDAGLPLRDIGAELGISRTRVQEILREQRR
jgi:hypothetical protein